METLLFGVLTSGITLYSYEIIKVKDTVVVLDKTLTNDFKLVMIQTLGDERGITSINDYLPIVAVYNFSTKLLETCGGRVISSWMLFGGGGEGMNNVYQNGFWYWVASDGTPCDYVTML